jgi:AraC-like DNA-binding protein
MKEYTDKFTDFSKKSISDFILYNCGSEQTKVGYQYGPKVRDYHFIHFVVAGEGTLAIDGKVYPVHENQCFIVPAGEVSTYQASFTDPWQYCWIGFLGIESNHYLQVIMNAKLPAYVIDCKDAGYYQNKVNEILEISDNKLSSFIKINGLMYEMMGNLLEASGGDQDADVTMSMATQAARYMDLHFHDNVQIADVADFVGVHKNYLSTIFKAKYHVSPKQYLLQLQLKKAKELLLETNHPVNIVAGSVGFSDALAFSKYFKKETGFSPTNYRKQAE